MQSHLMVGPNPTSNSINASPPFVSSSSIIHHSRSVTWPHHHRCNNRDRKSRHHRKRGWLVAASSSSAAIDGDQDHYAVLGLSRSATSADVKRAYRLLARKYHPDVSKHPQAANLFKCVRLAYEILSNEVTRHQYDRLLRFREDNGMSHSGKRTYSPEFEDGVRIYRWAELRRKMQREKYWEHYNVNEESASSDTEELDEEGNLEQERGPFSEVLRSAFLSLFLLHTFGSRLSLTFSSLMAVFDRKLDGGYKIGYIIAWILGGTGGILLTLCLQFASWVCGKTSSSIVVLVVVAMWVVSNLAKYAPLPQGALLTLLYMSIKLQADLN